MGIRSECRQAISSLHDFYHFRGAPIELGLTDEFRSYHPGFYNGIFSLAMAEDFSPLD